MAILTVTENHNFQGDVLPPNIDSIVFKTSIVSTATFDSDQFGAGLISDTVQITGDAFKNRILVDLTAAGLFSAAGWTFVNWTGGPDDLVFLGGTSGADNLTGSSQDDIFEGGLGADVLVGGGGDDEFQYQQGHTADGEVVVGGSGFNNIRIAGAQAISSDFTNTTITGIQQLQMDTPNTAVATFTGLQFGAGAITLIRGNTAQTQTLEINGAAIDLSAVAFVAGSWGATGQTIKLTGTSTSANTIVGSSEDDTIASGASLSKDALTGGGGADKMSGGRGADAFRYFSASEAAAGETVNGGLGTDTIEVRGAKVFDFAQITIGTVERLAFFAAGTAGLAADQIGAGRINAIIGDGSVNSLIVKAVGSNADLSNVTFTNWIDGVDKITVNGSSAADTLVGSAFADLFEGLGNADTMSGLAGNDTYFVRNAGTTIVEAVGGGTADIVRGAVSFNLAADDDIEKMTTTSGSGTTAINLRGNAIVQEIIGNAGANSIDGKGGADTLRGLGGADTFVFATKLGGGNIDTIVDFSPAADRFLLSDAIFTALTPGTITADQFRANTTGEARDATDRVVYDKDSGGIFYDPDGLGGVAGVQFATVSTGLAITNADFDVV